MCNRNYIIVNIINRNRMNAIIALCHFCETHGPSSVFCTQTLRELRLEEIDVKFDSIKDNCAACNSIGNAIGFLSKDDESNANFLSTQTPVIDETITMVKQGAIRSLSCEVSSHKDGGFVFFGDASRGHVLSHTFYIRDAEARGFNKMYAIIILMKDKLFLLNIQPFLSQQLTSISTEIQNYAEAIYNNEQKNCSQRSQRLNGQAVNTCPRSLSQLTGEKNIFGILHSHFASLLWSAARYLTENITLGSPQAPPWLGKETEEGFAMVQIDKEEFLLKRLGFENYMTNDDEDENHLLQQDRDNTLTLRDCKNILGSDFIPACYCVIVGLQMILRGPPNITRNFVRNFKKLLPASMHNLVRIDCDKYYPPTECRILSLTLEKAVPQPNNNVFRVDFMSESISRSVTVKWLTELPIKWPNMLIKINKAVDEPLLSDFVLDKHLKVLIGEWKNKVQCIQKLNSNQDISKMKKILGIQPQDQQLINYWLNHIS